MIRSVLMLAPEAPYPLQGGGAYRTASLLNYFARFAAVDLILISESGEAALLPPGLVGSQTVIPLPVHSRGLAARYLRNARRALRGVPPLIDRMSGLAEPIERALAGRHWDLGVVEHFWCATYVDQLAGCCEQTVLDLHNVESILHERCAQMEGWLVKAGHRRFAEAYRSLEARYLPKFSLVLATSTADAAEVKRNAPGSHVTVFANSIPGIAIPAVEEQPIVVFSGNFEYHPNIDAVKFLVSEIWPLVRRANPELRLRLVGRGDGFIRHLLGADARIEVTGPVEDAFASIAEASLVIAPLRAGSGTRIKILEGWAARRAVIATPLAAEGLDARNGENILLEASAEALAGAIGSLMNDAESRERLAAAGRHTFERQYTWEAAWKSLDRCPQLAQVRNLTDILDKSDALRR